MLTQLRLNPPRIIAAGLFILAAGLTPASATRAASPTAGYMDYAALTKAVHEIAAANPACHIDALGASRQGRGILLLTLSDDAGQADKRPALLITAGIDARHRVGTETAIRVAKKLLADHKDLLKDMTVYVIPCVNPDGAEYNNGKVNYGHVGTLRVLDDDRDGAADEDGPQDLNGDGQITQMRRLNPPLDDTATMMADPACPRLLKKPNAEKGERAAYSVYLEGLDVDGDGKIAEDGPGEVDLDRNFMHRWPEHEMNAGPYQLCEPESAAVAKFVIAHRNIILVLTYGRHDNLINTPGGRDRDITGQAPKELDVDDVEWYKEVGKVFKKITGQERAPEEDTAGSFHEWLYAQRGIPSFATVVWGRPDASKLKDEKGAETRPADSQPATQPATQPEAGKNHVAMSAMSDAITIVDDEPQQPPPAGGGRGGGGGRRRPGGGGGGGAGGGAGGEARPDAPAGDKSDAKKEKDDKPKPADAEAAAWLDYSDRDRNHEGFIEWTPFDHPTLGKVEIGGFVPGFQMNPPADQLDGLADKQTLFIVELMKKRPKLAEQGPEVNKLAPGLYEVRFGIVNDGYLPTATSIARKARSMMPTIIRLSTPIEQIVSGERLSKTWGIGGSGERFTQRWILRVDDGSEIKIELTNPQLGNQTITFKAEAKP